MIKRLFGGLWSRLWSWWARWRGRRALKGKRYQHRVEVGFTETEWLRIQEDCQRKQISPAVWVRNQLVDVLQKQSPQAQTSPSRHVAEHDEEVPRLVEGVNALRTDKGLTERILDAPRKTEHSCWHLRDLFLGRENASTCHGTCSAPNPSQMGRPCRWGPGVAHSCPFFQPREPREPREDIRRMLPIQALRK